MVADRTQRIPSGSIPAIHSQKLPKASNTIVLEEQINAQEINENKWLSIMLGVISALILVILLSFGVWFLIAPNDRYDQNPPYSLTETETEWNTEHTEKF